MHECVSAGRSHKHTVRLRYLLPPSLAGAVPLVVKYATKIAPGRATYSATEANLESKGGAIAKHLLLLLSDTCIACDYPGKVNLPQLLHTTIQLNPLSSTCWNKSSNILIGITCDYPSQVSCHNYCTQQFHKIHDPTCWNKPNENPHWMESTALEDSRSHIPTSLETLTHHQYFNYHTKSSLPTLKTEIDKFSACSPFHIFQN